MNKQLALLFILFCAPLCGMEEDSNGFTIAVLNKSNFPLKVSWGEKEPHEHEWKYDLKKIEVNEYSSHEEQIETRGIKALIIKTHHQDPDSSKPQLTGTSRSFSKEGQEIIHEHSYFLSPSYCTSILLDHRFKGLRVNVVITPDKHTGINVSFYSLCPYSGEIIRPEITCFIETMCALKPAP